MTSTTDTSRKRGPHKSPSDSSASSAFNARAKSVIEEEIKQLVIGNDRSVFDQIERFFENQNLVKLQAKGKQLQTRQLDTLDRRLLAQGTTLRIRGECANGDLSNVAEADICVKDGKKMTESGAVKRNEYEARIRSFESITLLPLLEKYPAEEYPDLHKTLHQLRVRQLVEHFRIDCIRNRYVVELPSSVTGIDPSKKFFAELILDDVAFVMDLQGRKDPLIYARDMEVECEVLFKPCSYDSNPEAAKAFVSSPDLTAEDVNKGLRAVKMLLDKASAGRLANNQDSKAERGFRELDATLNAISNYLVPNDNKPAEAGDDCVTSAYAVARQKAPEQDNAATGDRLHKNLPQKMGHVVNERVIARRPMLS